jgi:hypothetical protein
MQYLQSIQETVKRIDEKQDNQADDIASLKESRAHMKGAATATTAISAAMAGVVAWAVSLWKAS